MIELKWKGKIEGPCGNDLVEESLSRLILFQDIRDFESPSAEDGEKLWIKKVCRK
jgi:hypothetical protein